MEPIARPTIESNLEPVTVTDEGNFIGAATAFHPRGGLFTPDESSVCELLRADAPAKAITSQLAARDLLFSVFSGNGVSRVHSEALSEAVMGMSSSELKGSIKALELLRHTFGNRFVPMDSREGEGFSVPVPDALRGLFEMDPFGASYVVPSQLIDYLLSMSSVEHRVLRNKLIFSYVGTTSDGIEVPPYPEWSNSTIDKIVAFANRSGARVVSFPLEFELIAQAAYAHLEYHFGSQGFKCRDYVSCAQMCGKLGLGWCLEQIVQAPYTYKGVALRFLTKFVVAMEEHAFPEGLFERNPLTGACVLLRVFTGRSGLVDLYNDYLRLIPDDYSEKPLPPLQWDGPMGVVTQACIGVSRHHVVGHPESDPVGSSFYGRKLAERAQIAAAFSVHDSKDVGNTVVLTGVKLAEHFRQLGVQTLPWLGLNSLPAGRPFERLGRDFNHVVISMGDLGGFNAPPSVNRLRTACDEFADAMRALVLNPPLTVAVCGCFDNHAEVPEWMSILGSHYDIRCARYAMGGVAMFWAYGRLSQGGTSTKRLRFLMLEMLRDLQVALLVRQAMYFRGQSAFPYKVRLYYERVSQNYIVLFPEGNAYESGTQSAGLACFARERLYSYNAHILTLLAGLESRVISVVPRV